MKRTILLSSAAFLSILSSCGVAQKQVSRTVCVEQLEHHIVQMPTVVELDICEESVKKDTTVSKHFFKDFGQSISIPDLQQALTGQILKECGADVLMEPKVGSETIHKGLEKKVKVEVEGYPAKYRKFRTMTAEDARLLREMNESEKSSRPISLMRFGNGGYGDIPSADILDIATAKAKTRKQFSRKLGYTGMYEIGYNLGGLDLGDACYDEFSSEANFEIATSQGYQFNKNIYLGAYIALRTSEVFLSLPVLAHARFYMAKTRVAPFFDVKTGVNCAFALNEGFTLAAAETSLGLGLCFGAFTVSADYFVDGVKTPEIKGMTAMSVNLKIGLTF